MQEEDIPNATITDHKKLVRFPLKTGSIIYETMSCKRGEKRWKKGTDREVLLDKML